MSVKSVLGSMGAFLSHHVTDLNAIGTALNGLLAAVPVNSGTRDHIAEVIATVENSAANIEAFLADATDGGATANVQISEADLETAVSARVSSYLSENLASLVSSAVASNMSANPPTVDGDTIDAAVEAYMVAHPVTPPETTGDDADTSKTKK